MYVIKKLQIKIILVAHCTVLRRVKFRTLVMVNQQGLAIIEEEMENNTATRHIVYLTHYCKF